MNQIKYEVVALRIWYKYIWLISMTSSVVTQMSHKYDSNEEEKKDWTIGRNCITHTRLKCIFAQLKCTLKITHEIELDPKVNCFSVWWNEQEILLPFQFHLDGPIVLEYQNLRNRLRSRDRPRTNLRFLFGSGLRIGGWNKSAKSFGVNRFTFYGIYIHDFYISHWNYITTIQCV